MTSSHPDTRKGLPVTSHLINIPRNILIGVKVLRDLVALGSWGLSPDVITKDVAFILTTLEITRVLEAPCQELGTKTKYIFLIS